MGDKMIRNTLEHIKFDKENIIKAEQVRQKSKNEIMKKIDDTLKILFDDLHDNEYISNGTYNDLVYLKSQIDKLK